MRKAFGGSSRRRERDGGSLRCADAARCKAENFFIRSISHRFSTRLSIPNYTSATMDSYSYRGALLLLLLRGKLGTFISQSFWPPTPDPPPRPLWTINSPPELDPLTMAPWKETERERPAADLGTGITTSGTPCEPPSSTARPTNLFFNEIPPPPRSTKDFHPVTITRH